MINKFNGYLPTLAEGGLLHYNLFEVAKVLGYTRPDKAVHDFAHSNEHFQKLGETVSIDLENCDERVLYAFLFQSRAPRAKDFQYWIISEVIPWARQQMEQLAKEHQKQIDLAKCRAYLDDNRKTTLEDLYKLFPTDIADEVIASSDKYYRSLGFLPPSDFSTPQRVHQFCMEHGVFNEHGDPTPEWASDVYLCSRWEGPYNGKWYAFGPKIVELVLAPGRKLLAELDEAALVKEIENFVPVRRKNKSH